MDIAYISALAALAGSVVGGLTSGLTTWLSQRAQARAGQLAREMSRRDDLYKGFIVAASKAYGEAVLSNEPRIQELLALYAMISRMRLMSWPKTVACASKVMDTTMTTYVAPNKTVHELHELAKSGGGGRSTEGLQRSRARRTGGVYLAVGRRIASTLLILRPFSETRSRALSKFSAARCRLPPSSLTRCQ
jgi:hypothetical protein